MTPWSVNQRGEGLGDPAAAMPESQRRLCVLMRWESHIRRGDRCSSLATMGYCVPSHSPACLPPNQSCSLATISLPLGRRGHCESVNSWATLRARKAEVKRLFRSGDHKASIADSRLVLTLRQGGLLSGSVFGGFYLTFSLFWGDLQ